MTPFCPSLTKGTWLWPTPCGVTAGLATIPNLPVLTRTYFSVRDKSLHSLGARGKKEPNPPCSKEKKKIQIAVSLEHKKATVDTNKSKVSVGGHEAKVSIRHHQSCFAPGQPFMEDQEEKEQP